MTTITNETGHFLRFTGLLWENMVFEHFPGWEMKYVAYHRQLEEDDQYKLELLDENDQTLISVFQHIEFRPPCPPEAGGLRFAEVDIYLPLNPSGRKLIFRRGEFVLYSTSVAIDPPVIKILGMTIDKKQISIRWKADHVSPLTFGVMYMADTGRVFQLAWDLKEKTFIDDLKSLPGSDNGRFVVLGTDGVRSSYDLSKTFQVPEKPPIVWIQNPGPGEILPADEPVSLSGYVLDDSGEILPADSLIWRIDGKVIVKGTSLALSSGLQPGKHKVKLEYAPSGNTVSAETSIISVAERSSQQIKFLSLMSELEQTAPRK